MIYTHSRWIFSSNHFCAFFPHHTLLIFFIWPVAVKWTVCFTYHEPFLNVFAHPQGDIGVESVSGIVVGQISPKLSPNSHHSDKNWCSGCKMIAVCLLLWGQESPGELNLSRSWGVSLLCRPQVLSPVCLALYFRVRLSAFGLFGTPGTLPLPFLRLLTAFLVPFQWCWLTGRRTGL